MWLCLKVVLRLWLPEEASRSFSSLLIPMTQILHCFTVLLSSKTECIALWRGERAAANFASRETSLRRASKMDGRLFPLRAEFSRRWCWGVVIAAWGLPVAWLSNLLRLVSANCLPQYSRVVGRGTPSHSSRCCFAMSSKAAPDPHWPCPKYTTDDYNISTESHVGYLTTLKKGSYNDCVTAPNSPEISPVNDFDGSKVLHSFGALEDIMQARCGIDREVSPGHEQSCHCSLVHTSYTHDRIRMKGRRSCLQHQISARQIMFWLVCYYIAWNTSLHMLHTRAMVNLTCHYCLANMPLDIIPALHNVLQRERYCNYNYLLIVSARVHDAFFVQK